MAHDDEDDVFDANGLLRDGATYRVPVSMMDALQRDVRKHFSRNSAAPARITDQFGAGGLSLHRPGYRLQSGGDAAVRDSLRRDTQAAYDAYDYRITSAWQDQDNGDGDDDEEGAAREAAIHAALSAAGASPDDIEEYLEGLDDDELMTGDPRYHVQAFRSRYPNGNQDSALRARARLEQLYRERDAALSQEWKRR
jgi:hypothetical protein